jgi:hypothetical protein
VHKLFFTYTFTKNYESKHIPILCKRTSLRIIQRKKAKKILSPHCTLAYCKHVHLISIEFQNIDNNLGNPPKIFSFLFNCYNLPIHAVNLSKILLQTIRIVRFKILGLKAEKNGFIFIFILHANKYIFEA